MELEDGTAMLLEDGTQFLAEQSEVLPVVVVKAPGLARSTGLVR